MFKENEGFFFSTREYSCISDLQIVMFLLKEYKHDTTKLLANSLTVSSYPLQTFEFATPGLHIVRMGMPPAGRYRGSKKAKQDLGL